MAHTDSRVMWTTVSIRVTAITDLCPHVEKPPLADSTQMKHATDEATLHMPATTAAGSILPVSPVTGLPGAATGAIMGADAVSAPALRLQMTMHSHGGISPCEIPAGARAVG